MMRQYRFMAAAVLTLWVSGGQVLANCTVIEQLGTMHLLQSRLAGNPDIGLFPSDIRLLRSIRQRISADTATSAMQDRRRAGASAAVLTFLANTDNLLAISRLDDPLSVMPHFTSARRQNLADLGVHLRAARCTKTQIATEAAETAQVPPRANDDAPRTQTEASGLEAAVRIVLEWRHALLLTVVLAGLAAVTPLIKRQSGLRRRRAHRHRCAYLTRYRCGGETQQGKLLDINCHGSKFQHGNEQTLATGTPIDILIDGEWTPGAVAWSNTHYTGVKFHRRIRLAQVAAVCTARIGRKPTGKTQNGAPKDAVS